MILRAEGSFAEAASLHERALSIQKQSFSPNHFLVGLELNNLANLQKSMGSFEKAILLSERALAILEGSLGPGHPHVVACLRNTAWLWTSLRSPGQARPLLEQSLFLTLAHLSQNMGSMTEAERFRYLAIQTGPEPLLLNLIAMESGREGRGCVKLDSDSVAILVREHALEAKSGLNPETEFQIFEFQIEGLWEEMGIQLIAVDYLSPDGQPFNQALYIVRGGSLSPFASSFGGFGLMSTVLLDGALYYSYSWGSGVHRSCLGRISLEKGELQICETQEFLFSDLFLRSVKGRIRVEIGTYYAPNAWQDGQPVGWLEYRESALLLVDDAGAEISPAIFAEAQK